ncbi:45 kDa calcium-binding protein-like [Liolophura sinensis]|uniref:45 kDa calcium-binding protein-like n=1 Tax=Liolophura sinensis TaxID=3198878 RepID=UPI0031583FDB
MIANKMNGHTNVCVYVVPLTVLITMCLWTVHKAESRAINKTTEMLEAEIKKSKLLAKWQLQKEVDMKLDVEKLKPPDHLGGVKMEQDGHFNKDYQKEVFLGNHQNGVEQEVESKLQDIFMNADENKDDFLSPDEVERWIGQKIQEHLDEALSENNRIFKLLDPDHDGFITWNEYFKQFLVVHGHDSDRAEKHLADYDTIELEQSDKDELMRYKFRWSDADKAPVDNRLSANEFLAFRHPEHSAFMLNSMASDIMRAIDKDKSGNLTVFEFIALPDAEVLEPKDREMDRHWQMEREREFHAVIDANKDGIVSLEELKDYVNPRHPNHAKVEAINLIKMVDNDGDNRLSLAEVMENKELLLGSKMVDTGRSFHDEF